MIFDYSKDTGLTSMFKKPEITYDYDVTEFEKFKQIMIDTGLSADEVAQKMNTKVNPSILDYARNTDAANQTQEGLNKYIQSTNSSLGIMAIKSKAAAIGVGALNTVATMGISLLASLTIGGIISFFDKIIVTQKEVTEAANQARENIEQLTAALSSNEQFVNESGKRFAELSQRVNINTGENLSLSDSEYAEFLEISNQLAELFPDLERKYIQNKGAIVQLDGGVNTIIDSLDDLIERQRILANMEIADNMPALFDGVKSNVKTIKGNILDIEDDIKDLETEQKESMADFFPDYDIPLTDDGKYIQKVFRSVDSNDYLKLQNELQKMGVDYSIDTFTIPGDQQSAYLKYNFNLSDEEYDKIISDAQYQYGRISDDYAEQINQLRQRLEVERTKIDTEYSSLQSSIQAWLSVDSDYKAMSPELQNVIQGIIDNFDWEDLNFDSWESGASYIRQNYLSVLSSGIDTSSINALFDDSMAELPVSDYIQKIKDAEAEIQKQLDSQGVDINFDLNFMVDQQEDLLSRVQNKLWVMPKGTTPINDFINSLNAEDLKIILELEVDGQTSREEIERQIEEYKENAQKLALVDLSPIHEQLDKIQSAYQTVAAAIEEYDSTQTLSLDTIQSLLQLDDKYLAVLYDENGQLQLNTESYNNLTKAKLQQMQVDIIANAMSTIASLNDEQAAKEYLKNTTLDLTGAKWEDVYATIKLARAELLEAQARGEVVDSRLEALDRLEASTRAKEALFKEAENSLRTSASNFYGTATSDTSQKENVFDWAANSISNLNREIDNLNKKLGEASLEDKNGIYEELNEKNEELVSATEQAANAYEQVWVEKSSKLSAEQKKRIMSGEVFDISTFKGEKQEAEYQKLVEAQQAYEQWQGMEQQHDDAVIQQKNDADDAIRNKIAIEEEKLAVLEATDLEKLTTKEKNKLLTQEMKIKEKILEYNKQLAKTDEEKEKLQDGYDKDLEDTDDEIYENERTERSNKVGYYDTRIKDVQNRIDLKELQGGHASKADYEEMNGYLGKQLEVEWRNFDEALALRDAAEPGTDEWYKYNDQVQEAQDNINACTKAQIENNRAIIELPIKELEEQNKVLEKRLAYWQEYKAKVESAFSHANYLVQDEIDILNKEKETITDSYDDQIKAIEDKKEALEEENDAQQRKIDLENAAYALEKAKRNKTVRVYRAGQGFVYESDQEEVRKAQDELDNLTHEQTVAELDEQIKTLNEEKEDKIGALDDEIKLWEDYADKLAKASELYDRLAAQRDFLSFWGESGEEDILNRDGGIVDSMGTKLFNTNTKIEAIESEINANETTIAKIKEEAAAYLQTVTQVDAAQQRVNALIKDNATELEAIEARKTKITELKDKWDDADKGIDLSLGNIELANTEAKDNENTILEERTKKLGEYKEKIVGLYGEIKKAVDDANTAYSTLQSTLADAQRVASEISALSGVTVTIEDGADPAMLKKLKQQLAALSTFHSGGIVGQTKNKLPEHLFALTDANLKPNETLAKLLNGEVVLNSAQMGNMFNNLNRAYTALTPLNKRESSPITVSIGDVNVYSPDNTDMIVNEIVKELPLKVVQRLHSK